VSNAEESALNRAESQCGFAVAGKFQFCPSCFADMLERWKVYNQKAVQQAG
jgi:hypothetical protein